MKASPMAPFPDIKRAAYAGRWPFIALLAWGVVMTGALYLRTNQRTVIPEAELTFQMPGVTEIERRVYLDYFESLQSSDLRTEAVQFGNNSITLRVNKPLRGKSDPRLEQIHSDLARVRDEAMSLLETEVAGTDAEMRALRAFMQTETSHGTNDRGIMESLKVRLPVLEHRKAVLQERIFLRQLPTLVAIFASDVKKKLVLEIITWLVAACFIAVAGGLAFGYGRLVAKR